jgi:hypothetical protein
MSDEKNLTADEAHRAITEASRRRPQVQLVREQLQKMVKDEEKGLYLLASAIRTLLRQG